MPLSQKQLQDVCMLHSGDHRQCRYLAQDDNDPRKWYCLKQKKTDKATIDNRIKQFVDDCKKKSIDPKSQGIPLGDGCDGYTVLKHIEQGYDKDNSKKIKSGGG